MNNILAGTKLWNQRMRWFALAILAWGLVRIAPYLTSSISASLTMPLPPFPPPCAGATDLSFKAGETPPPVELYGNCSTGVITTPSSRWGLHPNVEVEYLLSDGRRFQDAPGKSIELGGTSIKFRARSVGRTGQLVLSAD